MKRINKNMMIVMAGKSYSIFSIKIETITYIAEVQSLGKGQNVKGKVFKGRNGCKLLNCTGLSGETGCLCSLCLLKNLLFDPTAENIALAIFLITVM